MKSVLIGGTGFIGSALAEKLVICGEQVVCVGRNIPEEKVPDVEYVALDLAQDVGKLASTLGQGNEIFLLTGQTNVRFDSKNELVLFDRLLAVVREANSSKVFFTSSALVYGDCDTPAREDQLPRPRDPYSVFKTECERSIREKLPTTCVGIFRLANVYGSKKNRGFIGLVMKNLINGLRLKINGDGSQERDYILLNDVIEAMVAIRNSLSESAIVNVATGKSETLLRVIELVEKVTGKKIPYEITNVPVEEAHVSRITNDVLREHYGYVPKTFLEEGLQKTWEQYQ